MIGYDNMAVDFDRRVKVTGDSVRASLNPKTLASAPLVVMIFAAFDNLNNGQPANEKVELRLDFGRQIERRLVPVQMRQGQSVTTDLMWWGPLELNGNRFQEPIALTVRLVYRGTTMHERQYSVFVELTDNAPTL
jgi:hypothetical protein